MKKLLLSTALLGAMAFPALAQDQEIFRQAPEAMDIRASDFMGMRLYATEAAVEGEEAEGLQEGWEDIGEINDIILNRDGQVQAVLVDIGGFLGLGERTVAVSMDAIQFLSDSATAENPEDFFLVLNASRETLEGAPEYRVQEGEMTAEQAAEETDEAIEEGAEDVAAGAGAAVDEAGDEAAQVAEGTENAVEETGEEMADAGAEVADEAADAGEEVTEEAAQADMTDVQEDQAEVADTQADAAEEATEETAQATDEAADEAADETEMAAEGTTETEMEADQTAEAATEETATDEMAATDEAAVEGEEVSDTELTSAETPARTPITREGFVAATAEDFTADRLQGAGVFDVNDERVGEVGEILLTEDGQVSELVIDVGGFLGIGEKPVALAMDSVDILRQEGGEEIRVYVSQAEEELEAMPTYEAQ